MPNHAAFETSVHLFLVNYRALHLEARARDLVRWHEVLKVHYLQHIALLSRLMNPRLAWCYPDEDLMRVAKAIASKALVGTSATALVAKVLEQWILGVTARLNHQRDAEEDE